MPTQINGLPAHILLIHAVIVLYPLACIAVVLHAAWPAARRRLGIVTPALATACLVLTPITTNAGEWLEGKVRTDGNAAAIDKHADLGDQLWIWGLLLFLVAGAVWLLGRYAEGASVPVVAGTATAPRALPSWLSIVATVVAAGLALVTVIQLYRIGDSGSSAVWGYVKDLK